MPYPAVDVNGSLTGPALFQAYWGGSSTETAHFQRVRQYHPASTSNPIGSDGTRNMSAWTHYGGRWRSPTNAELYHYNTWNPFQWYKTTGTFETAVIDPTQLKVWDDGRAQARLNALASWSERQVEYSMALRQAGQTARMVGDLGKGLAHELTVAGNKYGTGVARHWKKLPGWYLQYLYGWKPLMDDIGLITDKLVKGFDAGNSLHVILKGRWKGRREQEFSNSIGGSWSNQAQVITHLLLEQRNTSVFKYAFPADRLPNLEPIGFFGGLWEGAPYSFVLDWIAPVGTWLNALDANALACYFVQGSSSEIVRTIAVRSEHRPYPAYPWASELRRYETSLIVPPYNFSRVLESPWSITSRVPFRTDLNLRHAAQGLALLSQAMQRLY
jgi:hypothetical protein